jgi:hypothetical protein
MISLVDDPLTSEYIVTFYRCELALCCSFRWYLDYEISLILGEQERARWYSRYLNSKSRYSSHHRLTTMDLVGQTSIENSSQEHFLIYNITLQPRNPSSASFNLSHPSVSSQQSFPLPIIDLIALLALNFQSLATKAPLPAAIPSVFSICPKLS